MAAITRSVTEDSFLEFDSGALSQDMATTLWARYPGQIALESPAPANRWRWRVIPQGWVGVFPVTDELVITVRPKVPLRSIFAMWEWAYDLRQFRVLEGEQSVSTLEDFYSQLARILAGRVLARGRKGLAREYVAFEEPASVVRGRLDMPHLVRQPWTTRPICHYDEHTPDVADNQLLAWTLGVILRAPACNSVARTVARRAFMMLHHSVEARPFMASHAAGRRYTRLTSDYEPMHTLCRFFLEHSGPSQHEGDRDLLPLIVGTAELFELFVARWLGARLPERYRLRRQERVDITKSGSIQFVIDLVIEDRATGRALAILDTKYKDVSQPSSQDISQVVAYAEAKGCERAALVYPKAPSGQAPFDVGRKRITPLVFDLEQDVPAAGEAFLTELMTMLGDGGGSSA